MSLSEAMNTKHTPGPYRDLFQVCDADGEKRGCAPIAIMRGTTAEKRANVRLIAAAPDLYETLQEIMKYFPTQTDLEEVGFGSEWVKKALNAYASALDALAKASGEQK